MRAHIYSYDAGIDISILNASISIVISIFKVYSNIHIINTALESSSSLFTFYHTSAENSAIMVMLHKVAEKIIRLMLFKYSKNIINNNDDNDDDNDDDVDDVRR